MNRRNFLAGSCGLVAGAALPTALSGCVSTGRVDASGNYVVAAREVLVD